MLFDRDFQPSRDRIADQRRLIIAAGPDTAAVKRYRDDPIHHGRHVPQHQVRHRLGDRQSSAVFELQRHVARDRSIGDRRAYPGMQRRFCQTSATPCPGTPIIIKRHAATRAGWIAWEP